MICPKCHRPLDEGDGQYVCCADADLVWSCTRCAKLSEGFAFPYGRCPHCAGELEVQGVRRVDGTGAIAGIRTAFEIELGGEAFYTRAAAEAHDPLLRELFARFAAMEREHMATLARRYHRDPPASPRALEADLTAIYAGIERRPAGADALFRTAIALEGRAAEFFVARAERAAPGSAERRLYRELAAEERDHAAILATEYARWQAGKPGLLASDAVDRSAVDGQSGR